MYCVECNADLLLVSELISGSSRNIIHSGSKSRVIHDLVRKQTDSKGLIDEDPGAPLPKYMDRFTITKTLEYEQINFYYFKKNNNYLIQLKPFLEAWILRASRLVDVDVRKYRLPNDPTSLHSSINYRLNNFRELVKELKEKSPLFEALSELIN